MAKDVNTNQVVARSYDGNTWEVVAGVDSEPVGMTCNSKGSCKITSGGRYSIESVKIPTGALGSPIARAARLMLQAGFGAPRAELQRIVDTYGNNFGNWVLDQMRLERTSARAYYRRRSNPRVAEGASIPQPQTHPCDPSGTRWHAYVFNRNDMGATLHVTSDYGKARFILTVDGSVRAELTDFAGEPFPGMDIAFLDGSGSGSVVLCAVSEGLGRQVDLCVGDDVVAEIENPAIDFENPAATLGSAFQSLDSSLEATFTTLVTSLNGSYIMEGRSVECTLVEDGQNNTYVAIDDGVIGRFDRRARFWTNTLEQPSLGGPGTDADECPLVPMSFINRDNCVRRPGCGGSTTEFAEAFVKLNETNLRAWYTNEPTPRYIYVVRGLRLEAPFAVSPCASRVSRWMVVSNAPCAGGQTSIDSTTRSTIAAAISASSDTNEYMRDIRLTGENCDETDTATIGARVHADGKCWQHVHPDELSVRDATLWTEIHDGNVAAMADGGRNPIKAWALDGGFELYFPESHPMTRWADRRQFLSYVGRYGDDIAFAALQSELQTTNMAIRVGALREAPSVVGGAIVCGSPDEVANVPALGQHYFTTQFSGHSDETTEYYWSKWNQHRYAINNLMFNAHDQLRQRVTWALLNFVVVAEEGLGLPSRPEAHLVYWDHLSRHAFGNYFDILRDVSLSPMMARYLTYANSRSYSSRGSYPDENYAREIMQLFSLGLVKLNDGGRPRRTGKGDVIPTYTNEDIEDFARIWTGLTYRSGRLNVHDEPSSSSFIDPLQIQPQHHDRFPKAKLDAGHIGDGYPLCDDLPEPSFLRPGARFELTGSGSIEGSTVDSATYVDAEDPVKRPRFAPEPGVSELHKALCAPAAANGPCTFPITVTLDQTLACTGEQECNAERVLSVEVYDPIANVTQFYWHRNVPCVRLSFFEEGRMLHRTRTQKQCGDPNTVAGVPACCAANDLDRIVTSYGPECLFVNEAMKYDTAVKRCEDQGLVPCTEVRSTTSWSQTCAGGVYAWANTTCQVQVQIYANERIGIVDPQISSGSSASYLGNNSFSYFRPRWAETGPLLPARGKCPTSSCFVKPTVEGDSCLCNVRVVNEPGYESLINMTNPTVESISETLFIGSSPPEHYGDGTVYSRCTHAICENLEDQHKIIVWLHKDDNAAPELSQRTIFELPPRAAGRPRRLLLNRVSTVWLGEEGEAGATSFRNPPNFIPLVGFLQDAGTDYSRELFWEKQVEYEIDAFLEHLVEHDNTAPFVAIRLIQNMVTSNPSPRYVRAVVEAFKTGKVGDVVFSETYGDMAATVYAILTDREARSGILQADPSYGMALDPLVKVIHLLRTLEYESDSELYFNNLFSIMGVQAFTSETVFNFFSPFFKPDGAMADSGLVAPQMEIMTPPFLLGLLNSVHTLVSGGFTSCNSGFGTWRTPSRDRRNCRNDETSRETADGILSYEPTSVATPAAIIRELSDILTGGRVIEGGPTWETLISEFERAYVNYGNQTKPAVDHAIKLLATAPEFHTTAISEPRGDNSTHDQTEETESAGAGFKAIVIVNLKGGVDSFSMLVPHSGCEGDLITEYQSVRGDAALDLNSVHQINSAAGVQPCTKFGMHESMPNLHSQYQDGDLLWFSNIGALVEPVKVEEYKAKSKDLPPSLFSHNVMQRSLLNVHAQSPGSRGILGRAIDRFADRSPPYSVNMAAIGSTSPVLRSETKSYDIISASGSVRTLRQDRELADAIDTMTTKRTHSVFADTYSRELRNAITTSERLEAMFKETKLHGEEFGDRSNFASQLETAALYLKNASSRGVERVALSTYKGGFDTHATFDLGPLFEDVDYSIGKFADELKAQGLWENTVVVAVSEFARTLRPNGQGTDHAWGGNMFVTGGPVDGGRVLGKFPSSLAQDGPDSLGSSRVRLLPSTSWEAMWYGILEWYGVSKNEMSTVLPNAANFPRSELYTMSDLMK